MTRKVNILSAIGLISTILTGIMILVPMFMVLVDFAENGAVPAYITENEYCIGGN